MAEIVFVTLLLGLVAGVQPVEVRVGPDVKSVRIVLGDQEIAKLTQAPWRTAIDFGPRREPQRLDAIAYDANGNEIGRATQFIDVPRSLADVAIVVTDKRLELVPRHLEFAKPVSARIDVDGKPLRVSKFAADRPALDATHPHVVSAEMRFADGVIARRELVLTGGLSYSAGSELTPVVVTGERKNVEGCFSAGGVPLHVSGVEKSSALVTMVRDPGAGFANTIARLYRGALGWMRPRDSVIKMTRLPENAALRILWPIGRRFGEGSDSPSMMFPPSHDEEGAVIVNALLKQVPGREAKESPRRFADAVAVAGVKSLELGRRRAVVLVLDGTPDASVHAPATVRRYLASIGVPLFVWSISGPDPEWGDVVDISTFEKLHAAIVRLNETLDEQRVVWLPVDPLTALHVQVSPECYPLKISSGL